MKLLAGITAAILAMQPQPQHTTLAALRDHQRVLLVFSNGDNALAQQQLDVAATNAAGFRERDLVLVGLTGTDASAPTTLLTPADDAAARRRFSITPGQFTVLLIGKDGGEKLRSHQPIPWDKLRSTIDSMPMRQQEMQQRPN